MDSINEKYYRDKGKHPKWYDSLNYGSEYLTFFILLDKRRVFNNFI